MASQTLSMNLQAGTTAGSGDAILRRVLVAALFGGCLPGATARWLRGDAQDGHSPISLSLEAARDAVAHVYSLPG